MADLTEEEYDALDDYYTQNPPKVDPAKRGAGFFTRRTVMARAITVDSLSADYFTIRAMEAQKTMEQQQRLPCCPS